VPALCAMASRQATWARELQQLLGDHHDSVVTRSVLLTLAEEARAAGEDTFTYGLMHQRQAGQAAAIEQAVPRYAAADHLSVTRRKSSCPPSCKRGGARPESGTRDQQHRRALAVGLRPDTRERLHEAGLPEPDQHITTDPEGRLCHMLFMELGSLVMERKMLLGIKARAERHARDIATASSTVSG
jgi:hypothetical protein